MSHTACVCLCYHTSPSTKGRDRGLVGGALTTPDICLVTPSATPKNSVSFVLCNTLMHVAIAVSQHPSCRSQEVTHHSFWPPTPTYWSGSNFHSYILALTAQSFAGLILGLRPVLSSGVFMFWKTRKTFQLGTLNWLEVEVWMWIVTCLSTWPCNELPTPAESTTLRSRRSSY